VPYNTFRKKKKKPVGTEGLQEGERSRLRNAGQRSCHYSDEEKARGSEKEARRRRWGRRRRTPERSGPRKARSVAALFLSMFYFLCPGLHNQQYFHVLHSMRLVSLEAHAAAEHEVAEQAGYSISEVVLCRKNV